MLHIHLCVCVCVCVCVCIFYPDTWEMFVKYFKSFPVSYKCEEMFKKMIWVLEGKTSILQFYIF